jgi:hypothetical protein
LNTSFRSLHFLAVISLFLAAPATSFAGLDCKEDFAKVKAVKEKSAYSLSVAERNEIQAFCRKSIFRGNDPTIEAFARFSSRKSPEFLFYLMLECSGKNGDIAYPFRDGLSKLLAGDTAPLKATPWGKMGEAKINFDGVPAAMQAAWKRDALANLKIAKDLAKSEQWDKTGTAALIILRTKLAMPYLRPDGVKSAVRAAASIYAGQLTKNLFPGMYPPKAFQFAKEAIKRELGLDYVPLTDLVALKKEANLEIKIISVDKPTVGLKAIANEGIFRTYTVENTNIPSRVSAGKTIVDDSVEWKVGERAYEAKFSATVGEKIADIAPPLVKLDYAGLWKDKKLTGMIFPGANMGTGEAGAHDVMNNYKEYYRDHGFRFGAPKATNDFEEFMKEEVSSGRMDYVIKEAHSDGTDTSMVKVIKDGSIATGRKSLPGGKEEVVYIFYPCRSKLARTVQGDDILYANVGEWMKTRSENGGKQIFFLDTSCFGIQTMCKLVSSVQNKNLVVGGSEDSLETFANEEGSGISKILDGIRGNKQFKDMKASGTDEEGGVRDKYTLPGMAKWKTTIHGGMKRSVDTKVELFEDGKKVDIETLGGQ